MKKELNYFKIGTFYGGNQDSLRDPFMKMGGCAALTACDSCIYLSLYQKKENLYPYDRNNLTQEDYIRFSDIMKPYLHPRINGIDRLEIYMDGFGAYLRDIGEAQLKMAPFPGEKTFDEAKDMIKAQIGKDFPVPCLILKHKNPSLKDYVWHWFLLTGYEEFEEIFMVKAVTYGEWEWLNMRELWDTGYAKKGGCIVYDF